MKRPAILILLLFVTLLNKAQTEVLPKQNEPKKINMESGLNIYSLNFKNIDLFFDGRPDMLDHYFAHGIYFKILKNRNALRFQLNYFQKVNMQAQGGPYPMMFSSYYVPFFSETMRGGDTRIGYQYLLSKKRFSPYLFADLRISYTNTERWAGGYYDYYTTQPYYYNPHSVTEKISVGMHNGIGFRFNISNRVAINLETNYDYSYFMERTKDYSRYLNRKGGSMSWNPFTFSMGFIF